MESRGMQFTCSILANTFICCNCYALPSYTKQMLTWSSGVWKGLKFQFLSFSVLWISSNVHGNIVHNNSCYLRNFSLLWTVVPDGFGEKGRPATEDNQYPAIPPDAVLTISLEVVAFKLLEYITEDKKVIKKIICPMETFEKPNSGAVAHSNFLFQLSWSTFVILKNNSHHPVFHKSQGILIFCSSFPVR